MNTRRPNTNQKPPVLKSLSTFDLDSLAHLGKDLDSLFEQALLVQVVLVQEHGSNPKPFLLLALEGVLPHVHVIA